MTLIPLLSLVPLAAAPAQAERIPVLVVSGANNHDWEWTTPSLAAILEESGRFEVEITYEPAKDLADRARLDALEAVVLDYNGGPWGDAAQETFLAAVKDGLGVVVIHAANNSGNGWPEYERLVGDLWRQGTGHGSFHAFDVEVVDRDHPVTRTLPTILKHPDELYHNLVNVHGVDRRVLATAFSAKETGGTGEDEPMILVRDYGKGRVFHTPLGHVWKNVPTSQASHRDPQFRGLVVRGTEWAARGTVDGAVEHLDLDVLLDVTNGLEDLAEGWTSLTDPSLWTAFGGGALPDGWRFDDDLIVREARAGDIVTRDLYGDFELAFEWKATVAGNSGIKYRIPGDAERAVGPEYQLLDPAAPTENAEHRAGALYDVVPAGISPALPWSYFHSSRIVVRGSRIEHWLDGVMVAKADTSSAEWKKAVADSKFKDVAGFAAVGPGRILLQDHGDEVWIRGLQIRALESDDAAREDFELVFPDEDLSRWSNVGDAVYAVENGTLIGRAGPRQQQSFLVSDATFGDFELQVDVRIAVEGNSGIQLRSHVNDEGRLYGYQAEIDPTDRAWSAGIFDEGRRGWLADLKGNDAAREAFDLEGWNRYRIECDGPRIRTWLNGVPAADLLDGADLTGRLGFQIHGGDDDIEIQWRDPWLRTSGRHAWVDFDEDALIFDMTRSRGVRMDVEGDLVEVWLTDEEDEVLRVVPISSHERWSDDEKNRTTLLWADDRLVVQIGDRTTHDVTAPGATSAGIYQPLSSPVVTGRQRCLPAVDAEDRRR
ncbi:MAG: family 16 glycoside hydrolase [Planctomycetota bacterium]